MKKKNLLYAQSGGVTPVINATACGLIEEAVAAEFGESESESWMEGKGRKEL